MTPEKQLRFDVEAQLSLDPSVDSNDIQVAVVNGVVTLRSHVPTVTDKWNAEQITKRIAGDGTVRLTGEVHSWREREHAEHAAWAAPGVRHVQNDICLAV